MEALEKENLTLPNNEFTDTRRSLQEAVNQVIQNNSGWKDIVYKQKAESIVMKNELGGILSVAQLSDGIRSMIGLVADIVYYPKKNKQHFLNLYSKEIK